MTLIERLRARLPYLRNDADVAYFREAADALEAADKTADFCSLLVRVEIDDYSLSVDEFYEGQQALIAYRKAVS